MKSSRRLFEVNRSLDEIKEAVNRSYSIRTGRSFLAVGSELVTGLATSWTCNELKSRK